MGQSIKRMARILFGGMLLLCIFGRASVAQVASSSQQISRPGFRANELIIKIRDELPSISRSMAENSMNTGSRNLNALNEQFGVTNVEQVFRSRTGRLLQQDSPLANVLLIKLQQGIDEKTALRAYASLEEVEYAELNYWYYIFGVPNDSFFSSQYALYSSSSQGIDAVGAWDLAQGDSSVIIAIVDTGIDYTHDDLTGKVIKGYDFVNEDFDPKDDNGHGTHVAGIAGAKANNGIGIAGVCPGCSLLAIKVVTADGAGANSWIANGISNAVSLGARVINLSLGGLEASQTILLAVQQAYQQGAIIVAASGNDGSSLTMYPAGFSEVIAVGATNQYGSRASFSSYGSHLELAAPGQVIYSTLPGNAYEAWNGTSMACPHVAGLAGLILSYDSTLTNAEVRQIMNATAQDLGDSGRDAYFGYGRINALSALTQAASGETLPTPTPISGENPYPDYSTSCGDSLGGLFGLVIMGLCWVNFERRKRKM